MTRCFYAVEMGSQNEEVMMKFVGKEFDLEEKNFFDFEYSKPGMHLDDAEELDTEGEERKMKKLEEKFLLGKIEQMKKGNMQMKMKVLSLEKIAEEKNCELKDLQAKLMECYEQIWTSREQFCLKIDDFLGNLSGLFKDKGELSGDDLGSGNKTIERLKKTIAYEENLEKSLMINLSILQTEKNKVCGEMDRELNRLEECIQLSRERCAQLTKQIEEAKWIKSLHESNNQLFSMVNLEDMKKLSRI